MKPQVSVDSLKVWGVRNVQQDGKRSRNTMPSRFGQINTLTKKKKTSSLYPQRKAPMDICHGLIMLRRIEFRGAVAPKKFITQAKGSDRVWVGPAWSLPRHRLLGFRLSSIVQDGLIANSILHVKQESRAKCLLRHPR